MWLLYMWSCSCLFWCKQNLFSCSFRVQSMSCSAFPRSTCCGCKWPFPFIFRYIKPVSFKTRSLSEVSWGHAAAQHSWSICTVLLVLVETYSHCVFRSLQMLQSHALFHLLPQYSLLPQGSPRSWIDRIVPWLSTIHKLWTFRLVRDVRMHLYIFTPIKRKWVRQKANTVIRSYRIWLIEDLTL